MIIKKNNLHINILILGGQEWEIIGVEKITKNINDNCYKFDDGEYIKIALGEDLVPELGYFINKEKQLSEPPYWGTIFIDGDIITNSDHSTFLKCTYTGQANRTMYDRRIPGWKQFNAFLFKGEFDDGLETEVQVNPEFESEEEALKQANKYCLEIGRIPTCLRKDMETVWIHDGDELFGGGNNNILIHTVQGDKYIKDNILVETFVHEGSHTSLDSYYAKSEGWLEAQQLDAELGPGFISGYAKQYPEREDIAESFLVYLAVKYRSDRISNEDYKKIYKTIPNRISFFESLDLDLYPIIAKN